jgi:SAM-dependent methyltransferase
MDEPRALSAVQEATAFWDTPGGVPEVRASECWLAKPFIRDYVNASIGGGAPLWPVAWFKAVFPRRFRRGLSVGCGGGALERGLLTFDVCETIDAFDGAVGSLQDARRDARAQGWESRLRYFAADFNTVSLPREAYDVIFFNQSLHHVARLEYLFRQVLRALKPDGVLYADEYVGPSRHQWWSPAELGIHQAIYALLPPAWRCFERVPPPVEYTDPSEAIRSAEIIPQLRIGFDIEHRRDYGGTLLSILVPVIDWSEAPEDFQHSLIKAERELLAAGAQTYLTVIVARPKRGILRLRAALRYFIEPKWRALRVHVASMFGRTIPY